jgi:hypothetical protein
MPRIFGRFVIHVKDISCCTHRNNLRVGQDPKSILELPAFAFRYLLSQTRQELVTHNL